MDVARLISFTKTMREHVFRVNSSRKVYSNIATKDNWSYLVEFILRGGGNQLPRS